MKVRTMAEIEQDPERVRVTVDVELSRRYSDEDVARLQASEAKLVTEPLLARVAELERSLAARDHLLGEATTTLRRVRESVWAAHLDEPVERRGVPSVVQGHADELAAAVSHVRALTGQP